MAAKVLLFSIFHKKIAYDCSPYAILFWFLRKEGNPYFTTTFVVFTVPSLWRVSTMFRPRLSDCC